MQRAFSTSGLLAGYRDAGVRLIAVDYTHPTAVNPNAKLYARHKLDFVMVSVCVKNMSCTCRLCSVQLTDPVRAPHTCIHSPQGTTGGDREKLMADVKAGGIYAVIAPNMAKQIVALQAGLEQMAETYPGAFDGYTLKVGGCVGACVRACVRGASASLRD